MNGVNFELFADFDSCDVVRIVTLVEGHDETTVDVDLEILRVVRLSFFDIHLNGSRKGDEFDSHDSVAVEVVIVHSE